MTSIIVDAGPLIALFRRRDAHHARVKAFLARNRARLVTTLPVVTEVCHFLNPKGKVSFLAWIRRSGLLVHAIETDHLDRISSIIERYADQNIDFADASLIWLADPLNTHRVMTIDRADFSVFRATNGTAFELVLE